MGLKILIITISKLMFYNNNSVLFLKNISDRSKNTCCPIKLFEVCAPELVGYAGRAVGDVDSAALAEAQPLGGPTHGCVAGVRVEADIVGQRKAEGDALRHHALLPT